MAIPILTLLVWLPFAGFLVTVLAGSTMKRARWIALGFSLADLALAVLLLITFLGGSLDSLLPAKEVNGLVSFQYVERYSWVPTLGISYILGIDGLSMALVLLTPLLTTLAIGFSWDKDYRPKAFFGLLLLMEWSILGVFLTLDFFLFFIFWELVLIPMFFLIGIWGGPNRSYASIKFLIYTHVGSVIMLLSIFVMYLAVAPALLGGAHSFDMIAILGAMSDSLHPALRASVGMALQVPVFLAFLFGFMVKLPSVPFHTWLPDAHVEAPTAGSVILAGLLLKMGGYGIFRIALPMLPDAAKSLWWVMAIFGVVSMVYASFVCLAQVDLKKLIAYSSIGHMGFVLLGASSLTTIGIAGGIFQLFNHGIITAALFMLAGTVKHSAGTRDIPKLRGLGQQMPMFSFVLMISFFASLGLPGLNSFVSEFMVFTGAYTGVPFQPLRALILIPLVAVVLTGAYYVWTMHKIVFGAFNQALGKLHDLKRNEVAVYGVLIILMFVVGFLPAIWLGLLTGTPANLGPAASLALLLQRGP